MSTFITFTVNIVDNCPITNFNMPGNGNTNYYLFDPALTKSVNTFTSPLPYCGSFTYSIVNDDLSTPIDTTVFTATLSPPQIVVYSTDFTKEGTVFLRILGYQGTYIANAQSK